MARHESEEKQKEDMLAKMRQQVEDFLHQTVDARAASEKCRDYKDGKQWTDAEKATLLKRRQAPIVINRVKPKVEGLLGLVSIRLSDPVAYPRTQKHDEVAEAATDGLRYVADNNVFNEIKLGVAENVFVEGYGGVIIDVKSTPADPAEINISEIPWDRIYFDPHSRRKDCLDARYMGIIIWMDEDEAQEKFPDIDFEEVFTVRLGENDTFQDRAQWIDRRGRRVRIAQHFYIHKGVWHMCYFTDSQFLLPPMESPYLDEFSEPFNPIELVSAYVDRQNNRYGEVLSFLDPQDEINHRRSKALHLLSQRQTAARQGAVKDIAALKRELAKPDGHVEYTGEKGDFEILQTSDMARGQFELYQDAKNELDAVSYNAQLSGERQGDLSGKAIEKLQSAGTIELNGLFATLNGWEKRVYRQIWARIKQFWNEEKWVRITDDVENLRWVGFNAKITAQQFLEEVINDKSEPEIKRKKAAAAFTFMMQNNDPALEVIVDVKNDVAEMDVDIIIEQSFDSVNIQQEQFDLLAKFAQAGGDIDITELIRLSGIRGKDEMIARIEKRRQEMQQSQMGQVEAEGQRLQAETADKASKAGLNQVKAQQTQVETAIMIAQPPDRNPQVNT